MAKARIITEITKDDMKREMEGFKKKALRKLIEKQGPYMIMCGRYKCGRRIIGKRRSSVLKIAKNEGWRIYHTDDDYGLVMCDDCSNSIFGPNSGDEVKKEDAKFVYKMKRYSAICFICGKYRDGDTPEDVLEIIKREGWWVRIVKNNGKIGYDEIFCPECYKEISK